MTDYMNVADIEQPPAVFWAQADRLIARRRALVRELEELQEGVDRLNADIDEVRV